jgi:membrane protein
MRVVKEAWGLLKTTYNEWSNDNTSQLAAALAFYGVFAIAPSIIIAVYVAGQIFGDAAAQGEVARRLQESTSPTIANSIQDILKYSQSHAHGPTATIISIAVLIVAVLGFFSQLQQSLDTIWGVQVKPSCGYWAMIKNRLPTFFLMLLVAILLLASLIINSTVETLARYIQLSWLGGAIDLWRWVNWGVTFVLVSVLFALIYKLLPDVKIAWKDVAVGAVITAVLFTVGNYLIGLYISKTSTASAYGAAGSLVVVLLWVYYSSQILLFGAEFTEVWANKYGRPLISEDVAEPCEKTPTKPVALRYTPRPQNTMSHS